MPEEQEPTSVYGPEEQWLFDITYEAVIGSVVESPAITSKGRRITPYEAAFLVVARADTDGTFRFPDGMGGTYTVTRTHHPASETDAADVARNRGEK